MPLAAKQHRPDAEQEIRAIIEELAAAIRSKNIDALMAHYAADVLAFDLLPPLQYEGAAAVRKRASEWLASFEGPVSFEIRDLRVMASEDVGFCHSLNGIRGTGRGGAKIDMWWRATNGFVRRGGRWLVTHAHSSEPFDMQSGEALLGLKP
jgi:ketosteroid isomerase-like protein